MSKFVPHIVAWAVLATVVAFLALYRRRIRMKSDEVLHVLDSEASLVATQGDVAQKLESVDRWGKWLTVLAALYAAAIAVMYLYSSLSDSTLKMN